MSIDFGGINYLAVLVAVLLNMGAGALWYSHVLWAKPWTALTGVDMAAMGARRDLAMRGYGIAIGASILIAITMAVFAQLAGARTLGDGLVLGLLAGIGFVGTTGAANYSFENRPLKLYLINVGYPMVSFLVMGVLIALWHK